MKNLLGRFRVHDSLGVHDRNADELEPRLREPQYDYGNAHYILSLPAGEYEGEEAGDMMNIRATGGDIVCTVPAGAYKIENDDAGTHLYRMSDEPERQPLSDTPVNLFGTNDMPAALTRMNERMHDHYKTNPDPTKHVAHRDLTGRLDDAENSAALVDMNARNNAFWNRSGR